MRKISLQSSLQTTHTTAWKCRSLCSPGRGAAASYFGRRSGISVAWGEILDTDTRVREVAGSLLSELCSSAGQPTWGQRSPSIPPRWWLPLKSSSACTSCHSSTGAAPGPAGPLSSRDIFSPGSFSAHKARGCMFPKHRDLPWAAGSGSSSRVSPITLPSKPEVLEADLSCFKVLLPFPAEHSVRGLAVQRDK